MQCQGQRGHIWGAQAPSWMSPHPLNLSESLYCSGALRPALPPQVQCLPHPCRTPLLSGPLLPLLCATDVTHRPFVGQNPRGLSFMVVVMLERETKILTQSKRERSRKCFKDSTPVKIFDVKALFALTFESLNRWETLTCQSVYSFYFPIHSLDAPGPLFSFAGTLSSHLVAGTIPTHALGGRIRWGKLSPMPRRISPSPPMGCWHPPLLWLCVSHL